MEDVDPQVRDVYAEYGCVMGEVQLIERYLVCLAVAAWDVPVDQKVSPAGYDRILERLSQRTLGGLVRSLGELIQLPPAFEARLLDALTLRNWIVHRYFGERAEAFQTEAGRTEMIRELDEIGDGLHRLFEFLDDFLVDWLAEPGASATEVVERLRRMLAKPNNALEPSRP